MCTLMLMCSVDISVLGTGLPITVAYGADYQANEDTLQMDLFGHDTVFDKAV